MNGFLGIICLQEKLESDRSSSAAKNKDWHGRQIDSRGWKFKLNSNASMNQKST